LRAETRSFGGGTAQAEVVYTSWRGSRSAVAAQDLGNCGGRLRLRAMASMRDSDTAEA
jgi:hypothetical protein